MSNDHTYEAASEAYKERVINSMPEEDREPTREALRRNGMLPVTLTSEQVDQALRNLSRVRTTDLATDLQTTAEELAMNIISKLGVTEFSHLPDTFDYYIAAAGVNQALRAILVAINDVRTSWKEDGTERIKRYRKREAQKRAGQLDMMDDNDGDV